MKRSEFVKNGFSFIELLLASVITFMLIVGIMQLSLHSIMVKKRSDHRLNISAVISTQLAQLKSTFFSNGDLPEGAFETNLKAINSPQTYVLQWKIQSEETGMKSIELMCFPENSPQMATRLFLFISRELGF